MRNKGQALQPIFMTKEGEAGTLDSFKPHKHMVFSTDGTPASDMPFDLVDKTVAEIKEMGFEEVVTVGQQ